MDAAIAGLLGTALGAVLGAGGALGAAWIQQGHQTRRERLKAAADLGLVDFNQRVKVIQRDGGTLVPLSVFVAYHADVLEVIAKKAFDPEAVAAIDRRQIALVRAIEGRPSGQAIKEGKNAR
ncbi:hypothetical protein [Variovorax paradoxus]|uniref:Uncharacterized protein n=1 Tax=Variovorax paradoxus (strain EPS) TaxID=595537 RepID=E6V3Q5_VARPE|nr:hypothetical protein [Variovorax paradoxus]ADU36929.1 hypothetical protein Varpa_2731 [Variovorax paradoxus EPS]